MGWLRRRRWRTVGGVAVAGAALTLSACGTDDGGSGDGNAGGREARYMRVLKDPHPSPADVIEAAGAPYGVARADDGSLLLTYNAGNVEDDEGPAATAWRIVGPDGRTVAEHAEHADAENVPPRYKGVPGGFVRAPSDEGDSDLHALDVRGKRMKVVVSKTPEGTRPGDILLGDPYPARVYRPATHTVAPVSGALDDVNQVVVDERGAVWSLRQPLTDVPESVVRQRDGRTLGSTAVPKPYWGGVLTARGGTAALALLQGEDESQSVRGLLVTTDDGEHWRTVLGGGIPWQKLKDFPDFGVLELLADGRLLVGEEGGRYWLADDRTADAFHELKTPAIFTSFAVDGTTLYGIADATTPSYDLVKGEGLWTSRDGGREWRRYEERG